MPISRRICVVMLLVAWSRLAAQEELAPPDSLVDHGWRLHGLAQFSRVDLSELNSWLTRVGQQPFDESSITFGFGGATFLGRFWIAADVLLHADKHSRTTDSSRTAALEAYSIYLNTGFVPVAVAGLRLHPLIGIGIQTMTLDVRGDSMPTFGETLTDPGTVRMKHDLALLTFGLGVDYYTPVWMLYAPLAVGLRGGYRISGGGSWNVENGPDLVDGPELERRGWFLQLQLGLGI